MSSIELNLPRKPDNLDSQSQTKKIFNTFYAKQLAYPSNEVDAVIGFLENKGFDKEAAKSTGAILLQQAKIDGLKVFELLDTLGGLNKLQLSFTVAQVINFNRQRISSLGFRVDNTTTPVEARNLVG
tara:strand:- start:893 stop:1273 length:381 start_codon:yes stop_codon:yes gene_type:complete